MNSIKSELKGRSKANYRPEIDGLRALAVLPVIFFHAGFQYFSGGFIGVDVFCNRWILDHKHNFI